MTWIEDFMEATKGAESPRSYFYWSALAAISATVRNKVYLDKHFYNLYPNVYILLVGRSGLRKSYPVNLAKQMVAQLNITRIISGRNSVQSIIQELGRAQTAPGRPPIKDAVGFIVSGEMGTLLIEDSQATNILMDLHDGHYNKEWKNTLKTSGVDELRNVNVTLLGAINPELLKDIIHAKEIKGGFVARTMLVVEHKKAHRNPLIDRPKGIIEIEKFLPYLRQLSLLEGGFVWSQGARDVFTEWYMGYDADEKKDDQTGTAQRIHDQVLKVAMLIALAERPELVLEERHIDEALDNCLKFESSAKTVTQGTGSSEMAPKIKLVVDELLRKKEIKKSDLLRYHYGDFDVQDLDRIMPTLLQARMVTESIQNREVIYKATPVLFEAFEVMQQKRKKAV